MTGPIPLLKKKRNLRKQLLLLKNSITLDLLEAKKMKLYMAITADKFELPLLIEDNIDDFARKLGLTKNTVWCEICRENARF